MRTVLVCEDLERLRSCGTSLAAAGCEALLESDPGRAVERALSEGAAAIAAWLPPTAFDLVAGEAAVRCPDVALLALVSPGDPKPSRPGAEVYLESDRPELVLPRELAGLLERQRDGGALHGIAAGMFLQVLEMERRTCTLRLTDKASGRTGVLFLRDGELVDARLEAHRGEEAAREVLGWSQVDLAIQNTCPAAGERQIRRSLEALILDTARLRDEASGTPQPDPLPEPPRPRGDENQQANRVQRLRARVEAALGPRAGILDAYAAPPERAVFAALERLGRELLLGDLETVHCSGAEERDFLWFAGTPPVLLEVDRKAPRDRLLQVARSTRHEEGAPP
jgi:hypothetical protein